MRSQRFGVSKVFFVGLLVVVFFLLFVYFWFVKGFPVSFLCGSKVF